MDKSTFTPEYAVFLDTLRETRQAAGVTQVELADRLGQSQSFVSKCERGESRLDIVQVRKICHVLGTSLPAFRRVQMGLGLTFQTNRAFHALSVRQNLAIPSRLQASATSPAAAERYQYALKLLDVDPANESPARALPHHKLQWLEILMVLAAGPDVLLLDEPTAGMSPDETLQTARVLQSLNQMGLTIVVVEHDISFVREVAQVVTVLHQGRIFSEGTVAEVTANADVRKIYLGRA